MKAYVPFVIALFACCENLTTILNACAGARGTAKDIIEAYVTCEDDLTAIGTPASHVISTVTMDTDKVWYKWDIDTVGSSFKVATQGEGQAQEYVTTVILRIAGMASGVSYGLNDLIRGNAMLIIKDKNGNKLLIGALGDGANVTVDQQNDPNGYIVTFKYTSPNLPYFYSGSITLS